MEILKKDDTLFLIPKADFISSQIEEIRNFFLVELKKNHEESNITLDAQGVNNIDSLGVNLIIGLYKEIKSQSKTFRIINAGEKFMKIANFFRFQSLISIEGEIKDD